VQTAQYQDLRALLVQQEPLVQLGQRVLLGQPGQTVRFQDLLDQQGRLVLRGQLGLLAQQELTALTELTAQMALLERQGQLGLGLRLGEQLVRFFPRLAPRTTTQHGLLTYLPLPGQPTRLLPALALGQLR